MAQNEKSVVEEIKALLSQQPLAVLATQGEGQPYTSLMAYAYTDDLSIIMVATAMATRKHKNITGESRVALLVDDRSNHQEDFQHGQALTIVGEASEVLDEEREEFTRLYLDRHPALDGFIRDSSTALFKIAVHNYLLVSNFQEVVEYRVRDEDEIVA